MEAAGHTGVADAEGSCPLTKFSVSRTAAKRPAIRLRGSNMVKTKRGIGGRMDAMIGIANGGGCEAGERELYVE